MFLSGTGYKSTSQPKKYQENKKIIDILSKDETADKSGSELIWLWVVIEPNR